MDQSKPPGELGELRSQIDGLDRELVELMARRSSIAERIGVTKLSVGSRVVDAAREVEVRANAHRSAQDRLPAALLDIHVELMLRASRAVQSGLALRVAHLGPVGTHSEAAARAWFPSATLVACSSLRDTVESLATLADLAVIPWWNRHSGPVLETHEALLYARGWISPVLWSHVPVQHVLAASGGHPRQIFTRPEPWAASHQRVTRRYPSVDVRYAASNGEAARLASQTPATAAVTTRAAAEHYRLNILIDAVDGADNLTTFAVFEPSATRQATNRENEGPRRGAERSASVLVSRAPASPAGGDDRS